MIKGYTEFIAVFNNGGLKMINEKSEKLIKQFSFYHMQNDEIYDHQILQKINESQVIIIDTYHNKNNIYIIICFDKQLIIMNNSYQKIINTIFSRINEDKIYFVPKTINGIQKTYKKENSFIIKSYFEEEVLSFSDKLQIDPAYGKMIISFWNIIKPCISAFLIKKSYFKNAKNRLYSWEKMASNKSEITIYNKNDFIFLRTIGITNSSRIDLCYHIESEQIYAVKTISNEIEKLEHRELNNYKSISYPFIPKFYGIIPNFCGNSFVIEYINGETLDMLHIYKMSFKQKIQIIFEILYTFQYLHQNHFIYRDLKPNNLILDENNNIVLIDFDRMIKDNEITHTDDVNIYFANYNSNEEKYNPSIKNDIYAIGKIIYYVFDNNEGKFNSYEKYSTITNYEDFQNKYPKIYEIYQKCLEDNPHKNLSISNLIEYFDQIIVDTEVNGINKNIQHITSLINYNHNYSISIVENNPQGQFNVGIVYYEGKLVQQNIDKAIHFFTLAANQNHSNAQFYLGKLNYEGNFVKRNINKAIYYYNLAANQNNRSALYNLGYIYFENKYIKRDIKRSIHYFSLAAKQNCALSCNYLGFIYIKGKYVEQNIGKAIYYFTLAANQNYRDALYNLGNIYFEVKYNLHDIKKSIHYLSLASKQNHPKAECILGYIYLEGKYVQKDINKAIQYFTLAAKHNDSDAQNFLGVLYYLGTNISRDMTKSLYYLTLSANQNNCVAQNNLGSIYLKGECVNRDIDKGINYLTLAANNNNSDAQYNLGITYLREEYLKQDISKTIYYLTLSAKQNHSKAQNDLGQIYFEGKYVTRDINKSIYFYTLSANQNNPNAQNSLGNIYYDGKFIKKDIDKAIYYFTLAANQNYPDALNNLGWVYSSGYKQDISKAIFYFTLAAQHNHSVAQYNLGAIYYEGKHVKKDIAKAIEYFTRSANQDNRNAQFVLGYLYIKGIFLHKNINKALNYFYLAAKQYHIEAMFSLGVLLSKRSKDIKFAIYYYKEASSYNHSFSKNNLAMIYRNGIHVDKNISYSIELLKESVKLNDPISMYNLSHIYFYDTPQNRANNFNKIIKMLLKSAPLFTPSYDLLCLAFINKYKKLTLEIIQTEVKFHEKCEKTQNNILSLRIFQYIKHNNLENSVNYHYKFEKLKTIDFMYDYDNSLFQSLLLVFDEISNRNQLQKNINKYFYDGFEIK